MDERCFRPEEPEVIYACETELPADPDDPFERERARVRTQDYREAHTAQIATPDGTREKRVPARPEIVEEMSMGVFARMFQVGG